MSLNENSPTEKTSDVSSSDENGKYKDEKFLERMVGKLREKGGSAINSALQLVLSHLPLEYRTLLKELLETDAKNIWTGSKLKN
jgi:hypothetical protein